MFPRRMLVSGSVVAALSTFAATVGACFTFDWNYEVAPSSASSTTTGAHAGSGGSGAGSSSTGSLASGGGGGHAAEDCTNGVDDDGDGDVDCADADCRCVPDGKPGWTGPFALYDGPGPDAPECGGPGSVHLFTAHAGLVPEDAACSACTCSDSPSGVACQSYSVSLYDEVSCPPGTSALVGLISFSNGNVCKGSSSASVVSVSLGGFHEVGTCGAGSPQVPTLGAVGWERVAVACSIPLGVDGACSGETHCGPAAQSPFEKGTCISSVGDVDCPGAPYTARRLFYRGVDDLRTCSDCTCAFAADGCSGTMHGYFDSACLSSAFTDAQDGYHCVGSAARYFTFVPGSVDGPRCEPRGGAPTGCAGPAQPTTVCCTAGSPTECPAGMVQAAAPGGGTFCVDATEVTNARYAEFLAANPTADSQPPQCGWKTSYVPSSAWPPVLPDGPVAFVDWCDAGAYCAWKGKRLCGKVGGGSATVQGADDPAESQWQAACTGGGLHDFPYGDSYEPGRCNDSSIAPDPGPVAAFSCCTGGVPALHDMLGGVREWEDACSADSGQLDTCLTRGGSFRDFFSLGCGQFSSAVRSERQSTIGFRCCAD